DLYAESFRLEPRALAGRAGHINEIFLQVLACPVAFGFPEAPLQIGDDALEWLLRHLAAQPIVVTEFDIVLARAIKVGVLRLLRQFNPCGVELEAVLLSEGVKRLDIIGR